MAGDTALNLSLIWPFAERGLAWSTSISAVTQMSCLVWLIQRRVGRLDWRALSQTIALLVPALGVLFTGDTLASYEGAVIPGVFNVDRAEMLRSIRRLGGLDFEVACFGHGAPVVGGAGGQILALAATP